MVKSPPHHIATVLPLPPATATQPGAPALHEAGGFARIMAYHHPSQLLAGAAIALRSGSLLPRLSHYVKRPPAARTASGTNLSLRPQVTGSGAGPSCEPGF